MKFIIPVLKPENQKSETWISEGIKQSLSLCLVLPTPSSFSFSSTGKERHFKESFPIKIDYLTELQYMLGFLDPLAPMGDQYQISPPIIHKGIIS